MKTSIYIYIYITFFFPNAWLGKLINVRAGVDFSGISTVCTLRCQTLVKHLYVPSD